MGSYPEGKSSRRWTVGWVQNEWCRWWWWWWRQRTVMPVTSAETCMSVCSIVSCAYFCIVLCHEHRQLDEKKDLYESSYFENGVCRRRRNTCSAWRRRRRSSIPVDLFYSAHEQFISCMPPSRVLANMVAWPDNTKEWAVPIWYLYIQWPCIFCCVCVYDLRRRRKEEEEGKPRSRSEEKKREEKKCIILKKKDYLCYSVLYSACMYTCIYVATCLYIVYVYVCLYYPRRPIPVCAM